MSKSPAKTVYVFNTDHRDPIWNKCFENYFRSASGDVVRSYADREEAQLDRWFELLPGSPYTSVQEITADLKKYLERNPDQLSLIQRCVAEGQLELTGGGTTIIDYNIVHGESIYRNYFYSYRWLEKTFGVRPDIGDCFDTFGLSQQLPQILNQFGIYWLPKYLRMFGHQALGVERNEVKHLPPRPFWRGLDGSLVCIQRGFDAFGGPPVTVFVNIQYWSCPECHGEGCRFCDYSGLDRQSEFQASAMEPYIKSFSESDAASIALNAHTEETIKSRAFFEDLEEIAKRYGVQLRYARWSEIKVACLPPIEQQVRARAVPEDQIDERGEPNPIGTGCFITRGILKRENRELEHLLMAAEKFLCFARSFGLPYPREALARHWEMMNTIQAHDAITGNHPDAPFEESRQYQRIIKAGAGKKLLAACERIAAQIDLPHLDEGVAVAVFNPLNWTVDHAQTDITVPASALQLAVDTDVCDWSVESLEGEQQRVFAWKKILIRKEAYYRIQAYVNGLPSVGYATFVCKPTFASKAETEVFDTGVITKDSEAAGLQAKNINRSLLGGNGLMHLCGNSIENERYRITCRHCGVEEIFDKQLGRIVAGRGAGDLIAFDDIGSLWDRMAAFDIFKNLSELAEVSVKLFNGAYQKIVITGKLTKPMKWELPEKWSCGVSIGGGARVRELNQDEVYCGINHLEWRQEIALFPGSHRVDFRIAIVADTENIRLITRLPLGFKTERGRAWYDIPYGTMEREAYEPVVGAHLSPDGVWPTIHWAGVFNREADYTCGFLNRGIPGQRFHEGSWEIHLHRSGRLMPWSARSLEVNRSLNPLGKDIGEQVYEYAFTSGKGDVAANQLAHQGYAYNSLFTAVAPYERGIASLPSKHSFFGNKANNVVASVIKTAEDTDDLIVRMHEVYGAPAKDSLEKVDLIAETSPMEDEDKPVGDGLKFRPHEIKTVRVRQPG